MQLLLIIMIFVAMITTVLIVMIRIGRRGRDAAAVRLRGQHGLCPPALRGGVGAARRLAGVPHVPQGLRRPSN